MMNTKPILKLGIFLKNLTCVTPMFEQTCVTHMWGHMCVTPVAIFAGIYMCSHTWYTHVHHACCNVCSVIAQNN